jgi:hypothetical protein
MLEEHGDSEISTFWRWSQGVLTSLELHLSQGTLPNIKIDENFYI